MTRKITAKNLARHIPSALIAIDNWNTWSMSQTRGGKPTKKPDGSVLDPANRFPFLALADVTMDKHRGVGFVLTDGVFVKKHRLLSFDVDACRDPKTGTLSTWASELCDRYDTFTEITPSGTGLRLWLLVKNPPQSLPVIKIHHPAPGGVNKTPEIQIFGFGSAQYVTVTGDRLPDSEPEILTVDDLDWFMQQFEVHEIEASTETRLPEGTGNAPSRDEIHAVVQRDPQGKKLAKGEWSENGVESASEGWWRLEQIVCRAANNHGSAAVDYLLNDTAFGAGQVDSKDPDRYTRRSWVERDFARVIGKTIGASNHVFDDEFDAYTWQPPRKPKRGSRVLQAADFDAECGETEMLVYGLFPARGLAQLFGEPSCGKTPFALSIALHVALGKDWFGYDMERPGAAVYMIGEDMTGVRDRMRGQLDALSPGHALSDLPFYLTREPGQLIDHEDAKRWIAEIRETVGDDSVSIVVVDTQNRNFGPGNENSTEDMTKFVDGCDLMRRELDCCVLLVHHVGLVDKDRARGSSVLFGALDAQYEVQKDGMSVAMMAHKGKNWAEPRPLRGTLAVAVIGVDMKGRDLTAITLSDKIKTDSSFVDTTDMELRSLLVCIQLSDGNPISQQELCSACSLTRKQLRTKIKAAVSHGLINITGGRGGSKATYSITERGVANFFPDQDAKQADIDELLS